MRDRWSVSCIERMRLCHHDLTKNRASYETTIFTFQLFRSRSRLYA